VPATLAARTERSPTGSLVLGQDQDCLGSCFSSSNAFDGSLAVLRIWGRALSGDEARAPPHAHARRRPRCYRSAAAIATVCRSRTPS